MPSHPGLIGSCTNAFQNETFLQPETAGDAHVGVFAGDRGGLQLAD
jgi:hypothetical protein